MKSTAALLLVLAALLGCGGVAPSSSEIQACAPTIQETACGVSLPDGTPCATCLQTLAPGGVERANDCVAPSGAVCVVSCDQC